MSSDISESGIRKTVAGIALAAMLGVGAFVPTTAYALTESQVGSILNLLESFGAEQSVIENVESSLRGETPQGGDATKSCSFTWTRDLSTGATGPDVLELQKFLNKDADTRLADSGVGSPGNETSYYGAITAGAVARFQEKHAEDVLFPLGLSNGTGYFGASTRAKVNDLCTTQEEPSDNEGDDEVNEEPVAAFSVDGSDQPEDSLVPEGAARVPFTRLTLTAGDSSVVVDDILVQREGLGRDSAFDSIVLLDEEGLIIGSEKRLNSKSQAHLSTSFTVPAGEERTVTVAANMEDSLDDNSGERPVLSVIDIDASEEITGALPVVGAEHTLNATLTIGSADITEGSDNPDNDTEEAVGEEDVVFISAKVSNTSADEDILVRGVRFYNAGSISADDLENVTVEVNGDSHPVEVSDDERYFVATFEDDVRIEHGDRETFNLTGDISFNSNVAGRNIKFEIRRNSDVIIDGEDVGYGILPTVSDFSETIDIVSGGLESFSRNNRFDSGKVLVDQNDQKLGSFTIDLDGEGLEVEELVFNAVITGSADASDIEDIRLLTEGGATLAGPVDGTGADEIIFDDVDIPVGEVDLFIEGRLNNTFSEGDTIKLSTDPSADWSGVRGAITNDSIDLDGSLRTSSTQTVSEGGELSVSVDSDSPKEGILLGGETAELGIFKFSADDVEDFDLEELVLVASSSDEDVVSFYNLRNEATGELLDFTEEVNGTTTTVTLDNVAVEADEDLSIVVDGALADIDGEAVENGDTLSVRLESFKATGDDSDSEVEEDVNLDANTHTLFDAYPEFSWDNSGENTVLFPQARMHVDTLRVSNNGNDEFTIGTTTLVFLGDYDDLATSSDAVVIEDENGDVLASSEGGNSVEFSLDVDVAEGETKELRVYANTLGFGPDTILQASLEDVDGSVEFSIDDEGPFTSNDLLKDGTIYSQALTR